MFIYFIVKDEELRMPSLAIGLYERAVRNCPWSVTLWLRYARALERYRPQEQQPIIGECF